MDKAIEKLPQWYMGIWESDGYENVHETAKRAGNEFGIGPGMRPIETAMLERALHKADLLADARCLANAVNTGLPEMSFGNTVLRFGDEMISYDAYEAVDSSHDGDSYDPWPARPDEITVHAVLTHPDGTREEKAYDLDIALVPTPEHDQPPLAILSKTASVNITEMTDVLARAYACFETTATREPEVNEMYDLARTMATIACLGRDGRLTAIEQLAKTYIINLLPKAALPGAPITVTLFRNGEPEAEAAIGTPPENEEPREARNRRNLHRYNGTPFQNHPGIQYGQPVERGTPAAEAALNVPEGKLMLELGTSVNGTLVELDPNDRAVPRGVTHGVIWRAHHGPTTEKTVHLLDAEDLEKLKASSMSHVLQGITDAAGDRMMLCLETGDNREADKLQERIMTGASRLVGLVTNREPGRGAAL